MRATLSCFPVSHSELLEAPSEEGLLQAAERAAAAFGEDYFGASHVTDVSFLPPMRDLPRALAHIVVEFDEGDGDGLFFTVERLEENF